MSLLIFNPAEAPFYVLSGEEEDPWGDPRRCPVHPTYRTSDPWGMHDAPCGRCEAEMEARAEAEARRAEEDLLPVPPPRALPWPDEVIDDDLPF